MIRRRQRNFYKKLVRASSTSKLSNKFGRTAVQIAAEQEFSEAVNVIFQYCCDEDYNETNELKHFHIACRFDNISVLRKYISKGVNINAKIECPWHQSLDGCTTLHTAIEFSGIELVELLLENGLNPDVKDSFGRTPLHRVYDCGCSPIYSLLSGPHKHKKEVLKELAQNNADLKDLNSQNQTALHLTFDVEIIEIILKYGVDINSKDKLGISPLQNAVTCMKRDAVNILLKHGANSIGMGIQVENWMEHFDYSTYFKKF
ncbi:hypothetical protein TKK_0001543 [Trichogramma kaykai]